MLIKFNCLMPELDTCIISQQWNFYKKSDSSRSRLVSMVCSLKCFGNYFICWQLISVKQWFPTFFKRDPSLSLTNISQPKPKTSKKCILRA